MACRLCLCQQRMLVPITDKNGEESREVVRVAAKWLSVELAGYDKICINCWANLDSFREFCALVAEKQLQLAEHLAEKPTEPMPPNNGTDERQLEQQTTYAVIERDNEAVTEQNFSKNALNSEKADNKDDESSAVQLKEERVQRTPHARKIGRPRASAVSARLEEDQLVSSYMQLRCDICDAEADTFSVLKNHFKMQHGINGYAVCCQKRLYKRGILIDHIMVHKDPNYFTCPHCESTFADRVCLRNHLLLKHNTVDESPHQCEHCGKKFAKLYFLQRHMLTHVKLSERIYCCDICKKSYASATRLKSHHNSVHGDGGLKMCSHCGVLVRGKKSFERHLAQHDDSPTTQSVQCHTCGHWLSDKYCLRLHMELHEDNNTYKCALCGKEAPSRLAMNAHMRYQHTNDETLHQCKQCQRAFKTPRALREHITTHTGETLYGCNYCDKRFKCSSNLHAHRKWQHPNEWARDKPLPKTKKKS